MLDVLSMKYSIAAEALLFTFQKNPTIKKFQDQEGSCPGKLAESNLLCPGD